MAFYFTNEAKGFHPCGENMHDHVEIIADVNAQFFEFNYLEKLAFAACKVVFVGIQIELVIEMKRI